MYTNIFIPLTPEEIKKVNASELAEKYNVSNSYVSRVLKSQKEPTAKIPKNILEDARKIVELYAINSNIKSA